MRRQCGACVILGELDLDLLLAQLINSMRMQLARACRHVALGLAKMEDKQEDCNSHASMLTNVVMPAAQE